MVAWQGAILPRCHSDRASKIRQETAGRDGFFDRKWYASRARDLNAMHRVLPSELKIDQNIRARLPMLFLRFSVNCV
jgi:hypothetical protein